jgi:2,4-dienoyl-CoA reductase (NADPH2)
MEIRGKQRFANLFSDGHMGQFKTKNKIKYAACSVSNFNTEDGFVTERELARMEVIARTGAGVITNQGVYPDAKGEGKTYWRQLSLSDDRYITGIKKTAELLRKHNPDAVIIQQILHGGRYGGIDLDYCVQPSAVAQTLPHFRKPHEMSKEEIQKVIEDHATASRRSILAGFDGIEVTGFLGYLLSDFNSKFTNQRTDEYGGTLEKRARFMCELVEEVRKAIGPNLIIGLRLNGTELMDEFGGNTEEENRDLMKIAESAGVDYLSMVIGWHEARHAFLGRHMRSGHWLYLAEAAKKVLNIPLAFGPGFRDPVLAEKAIGEGFVDFWELCRPMLADPELVHKVWRNELEEIRPCIDSLDCISRMFENQPYICCVNPVLGHEVEPEYNPTKASRKKRVLVVGAGPAGLECALAADKRGHGVILQDCNRRVGGQLLWGAKDERGGEKIERLIAWYENQLSKSNIDIVLGEAVDKDTCKRAGPDVIVLATGSQFSIPDLAGIDKSNIVSISEVYENDSIEGDKIIVWGGGKAGMALARYLATAGKQVTIIEEQRNIGFDVNRAWRWRLSQWLEELKIESLLSSNIVGITNGQVKIVDEAGKEHSLPADKVVVAKRTPNQALYNICENLCDELYLIGDSMIPRHISTAIHEGYKLGNRI